MQIRHIILYPVKGFPGIEVNQARIGATGFEGDRCFMLVDSSGRFISQREFPELTRFRLKDAAGKIQITHADHEKFFVELSTDIIGEKIEVVIWDDHVEAVNMGNEYNNLFSEIIGVKCSLVWMKDPSARPRLVGNYPNKINVSFADSSPYLVISESSHRNLIERVGQDLEWIRFRPNIIIDSIDAYGEDELTHFGNEKYQFSFLKRCGRCQVPNLDPLTGEYSKEPLRTLNEFRKEGNQVFFGSYFFSENNGTVVSVGDTV
jgi:uncharacterized protein YcbX